jgi:glycolate oxidase/D-lactate dehydrogenase
MDRNSISASSEYMGISLNNDINASVLIEIDGNEIEVKERKNRFIEVLKDCEILNYKIAETEEEQEELWEIRRNVSPAISGLSPKKINEDIVVPVSKIPETVEFVDKLAKEYNLLIILFGHFGDGNIHTNLMVDPDNPEEMRKSEIALNEIFRYVISKKGSITGEHGVGISKKPFMKYQFSNREIELFKQVKRVFDPENLLNPGKIF